MRLSLEVARVKVPSHVRHPVEISVGKANTRRAFGVNVVVLWRRVGSGRHGIVAVFRAPIELSVKTSSELSVAHLR